MAGQGAVGLSAGIEGGVWGWKLLVVPLRLVNRG